MPIFIPLLYIGASVAASVALGYVLDKSLGDGVYTKQELATDVTLGLIPGIGLLKPGAKIGYSGVKMVQLSRAGQVPRQLVGRSLYLANKSQAKPIVKTLIAGHAVSYMYDTHWTSAFDPLSISGGDDLPAAEGTGMGGTSSAKKIRSYKPKVAGKCKKGFYYSKIKKMCVPYKPRKSMS